MPGPTVEHRVNEYIEGVYSGRLTVGKLVRQCIDRHLDDLEHADKRGWIFDPARGQHVIDSFRYLRHWKGAWNGKPFKLSPFQQFKLWVIFGWLKAETMRRRFRVAYTEEARKNGKSAEAGGVCLYGLTWDKEPGAEVYTVATKKDQALIVHRAAEKMVRKSPRLAKRVKVFKNSMSVDTTASTFLPLGADSTTLDGLDVHMAACDEIHAWKGWDLWEVIETATGAREQSLLYPITTAGFDRQSICYWMHQHTRQVLLGPENGGIIDDTWFGFIASLDEGDDWEDEANWPKANPNMNVPAAAGADGCLLVEKLREALVPARETAAKRASFQRLRLNIWTQQETQWINMEDWKRSAIEIDMRELDGRECYAGLDLASTTDVTAFVLDFPMDDGSHVWLPHFWVPGDSAAERQRRDRVPYLQWIADGLMSETDGETCDYDVVREDVNRLGKRYAIREIAYDAWNATQLATQLDRDGFVMAKFGQGMASMAPATAEFERAIKGRLKHGGHPVLNWMAGNCSVVEDDHGNKKPSKKKSSERIDGIVAGLMALLRATLNTQRTPSVYATGGSGLKAI